MGGIRTLGEAAQLVWVDVQEAALLGTDALAVEFSTCMCRRFDNDASRGNAVIRAMEEAGTTDWRVAAAWATLRHADSEPDSELAVHLLQFCNSRARGEQTAALILQRLMKASAAGHWRKISLLTARTLANVLPSLIDSDDEEADGPGHAEAAIVAEAAVHEQAGIPKHRGEPADDDGAAQTESEDTKVEEAMERERREHREAIDQLLSSSDFMKDEQLEDDHLAEDVGVCEKKCFVLFDHVNAAAMDLLASKELSKIHRLGRTGPTVERSLGDILVQCSKNVLPGGARTYKTIYHEESLMTSIKERGRRHAGRPTKEEATELKLLDPGVCSGHLAASTFVFPRWFRSLCRAGLEDHYTFDLTNAHVCIMAERHDSEFLREFTANRQVHLQSTHSERAIAKQLFLRLLYGLEEVPQCGHDGTLKHSPTQSASLRRLQSSGHRMWRGIRSCGRHFGPSRPVRRISWPTSSTRRGSGN